MTPDKAEQMGIAISYAINKILNVRGINLKYESNKPDKYWGSHDPINKTIYVNKKYFDNFAKLDEVSEYAEYMANFTFFAGIVAHETRHFYQSLLKNPVYIMEFLKETNYYLNMNDFNEREYCNLEIEIDAHAFQALIEEKLCTTHFPIPIYMNKEKFEKRYSELKIEYSNKIDEVFDEVFKRK